MIGWPALIILVLFLPAEVYFGWDIARARATAPSFVVSYLMGRIIGVLLISALVAWLFYRVFRRSTRAGTIAFSLVLLFMVVSTISRSRLESARQAAAAKIIADADTAALQFGEQPTDFFDGAVRMNDPAGQPRGPGQPRGQLLTLDSLSTCQESRVDPDDPPWRI